MILTTRRMFCPDTGREEIVAVPANIPSAIRNPFAAFYREKDMANAFFGKDRP